MSKSKDCVLEGKQLRQFSTDFYKWGVTILDCIPFETFQEEDNGYKHSELPLTLFQMEHKSFCSGIKVKSPS